MGMGFGRKPRYGIGDEEKEPVMPELIESMRAAMGAGFSSREVLAIVSLACQVREAGKRFSPGNLAERCGEILKVIEGEEQRTKRKGEW